MGTRNGSFKVFPEEGVVADHLADELVPAGVLSNGEGSTPVGSSFSYRLQRFRALWVVETDGTS